jgi:hypothetical protein
MSGQAIAFLVAARNSALAAQGRAHDHLAHAQFQAEEDRNYRAHDAQRCTASQAQLMEAVLGCQYAYVWNLLLRSKALTDKRSFPCSDYEVVHAERMLERAIASDEQQ